MDTSKITNVLIFREGYYWLTILADDYIIPGGYEATKDLLTDFYMIIPENWGLNNGFEFASDAYAYIASLQEKEKI